MEIYFFTYNPEAQVCSILGYEGDTKEIDPKRVFKRAREKFVLEFHDMDREHKITDDQAIMRMMMPGAGFVTLVESGERIFGVTRGWTKGLEKRIEASLYPVKIRRVFMKSPARKKVEEE